MKTIPALRGFASPFELCGRRRDNRVLAACVEAIVEAIDDAIDGGIEGNRRSGDLLIVVRW